jgi:RNA polymerase sigma-70 factor (ECF subfamily)
MDEPTDAGLLEAARRGDAKSLEALLERHQEQVYRFGMKMCRDEEDARDVLQDTLLAMARSVRDFRGASSISTWLYSIARGFCIKKRRRSKYAPETERSLDSEADPEASALADPGRGPDEELAGKEVRRALEEAIGGLEPMYREVLVLRDVEGLSAPEVAEVLGIGVAAVKSRLHRARASVRELVAPLLGIPAAPAAAAPGGCPDVLDLLSRHLEGEISAEVCADMERHVEACGRCRGACESLKRTLALCRTTPSAPVPRAVQDSVRASVRKFLDRSS